MNKKIIHSNNAPAAIGAYSQAVAAGGAVYISGQLGLIAASGVLGEGFTEQSHLMFKNLDAICQAAGGTLSDIVKINIFMTDLVHYTELNQIMGEYFSAPFPARAVLQVSALPKAGLVEADAVLVL